MAIKVIRRGAPPAEKKMQGTCRHCQTEIECLKGDTQSNQRDPGLWVKYPVCEAPIDAKPIKEVPPQRRV